MGSKGSVAYCTDLVCLFLNWRQARLKLNLQNTGIKDLCLQNAGINDLRHHTGFYLFMSPVMPWNKKSVMYSLHIQSSEMLGWQGKM